MESSFFDAKNFDRTYNSADFVRYFATFVGNGVFADPADGLQAYAKGGMVIGIKPGKCFINGRAGFGNGSDTVTLAYGDDGTYRYDAIVARLDLSSDVRDIHIDVIRGDDTDTLAAAVKPTPVREGLIYDIVLAYVSIGEGATSIDDTVIFDVRPDNNVCGFVTGVIRQFNSTDFFRQYQAMIDKFLKDLSKDDHVTINIEDVKSRQMIRETRLRIGSSVNVL